MNPVARRSQRGLSLVELMIGLVLGLLLIAAVIHLFISSKQSFRTNDNLARVQESGRVAIDLIGAELRKAGYRSDVTRDADTSFPATAGFARGAVIKGTATTFSVRYYGSADGNVHDCLGDTRAAGELVAVTIDVSGDSLRCTRTVAGVSTTQPLIDGVAAPLRFTYGEDTNGDNAIDIPYVATPTRWERVLAVRLDQLTLTAGDVSQNFATTVALRNPLR